MGSLTEPGSGVWWSWRHLYRCNLVGGHGRVYRAVEAVSLGPGGVGEVLIQVFAPGNGIPVDTCEMAQAPLTEDQLINLVLTQAFTLREVVF